MPRVILLSTDLNRGGLPLRLVRLAPRLAEQGFTTIVGCLSQPGPLSNCLEEQGIPTFACGARHRFDLACLTKLTRHIRRIDPDLIHASLFHANLAARLVGRIDRNRPILTSTVTVEIERPLHRWLESLTAGLSDLHIANSQTVLDHLTTDLGMSRERLAVVPNAIDLEAIHRARPIDRRAHDIHDDAKLMVWAGRMDPIKDLDTLIDVFVRVRDRLDARLALLGDGPERPRLQRKVEQLASPGDILLPGWQMDILPWLKSADVFLFTSRTEGSPNAVLEAIACNCPVVATDIPALRELLTASGTGALAPAGDVESLSRLVEETLRRGRSEHPSSHLSHFLDSRDLPEIARKWAGVYHRFLGQFP